ncbi:hypothetical protein GGE65_000490 [Skermanella aerolata]|uniref:Uncharacterized protein n=1 Tax=Skermanella aerolata TaxID=393310 RepID=A0A512DIE2_9PROT|nr:hypothetical protein [Skermanella aerolata]KJB97783.1 hypothetical protein N826_02040 [Skermanella aerolata KACC 11604]GEO36222.1 hypothetical protein SAE02_03700 [Skermanella aerolata]
MTRNLAVEFRIAANTLRRLTGNPDPRKAARAQEILGDKALFREFVDQRHRALRTRTDAVSEGDSNGLADLAA